jgi:methionyl aminopeptidase
MRAAGRIVALVIARMVDLVRPGVTTAELDAAAEALIRSQGAEPSFKGYHGYPASICTSVNEQVVHGLPGPRRLLEGDIISIDVGAYCQGFHGDAAITLPVGTVSAEARRLLQVTRRALELGITAVRPGAHLSDIGHAVQSYVEAQGFSVVREYVGHGIGTAMHEPPQIPNFGVPGNGPVLKPGMTLAIEPMVNVGEYPVRALEDGWTVVTRDGSLSAHFEHTVAVSEAGHEVLTRLEE